MTLLNIRVRAPYLHQGVRMHPKLIYAVPVAVHDGMLALGLADATHEERDEACPHLTWDAGTRLLTGGTLAPAPLTHKEG